MKKAIILIIMVVFFSSCDDFKEAIKRDTLIGKWEQISEEYSDGTLIDYTGCERKNSMEFFEDGTFEAVEYSHQINTTNNTLICADGVSVTATLYTGTWENTSTAQYLVRFYAEVQGKKVETTPFNLDLNNFNFSLLDKNNPDARIDNYEKIL